MQQAFALECYAYESELYGRTMQMCRNPEDAKDLVQETLERAMTFCDTFEPGSNLRAWLFKILSNAFINGYRKRRRHQRFAVERQADTLTALYGRDVDYTEPVDISVCQTELCDEVYNALRKLAPEYREVIERADLKGEKYKDIAEALGVPIGTVMSRLFRARRLLEADLRGLAKEYGISAASSRRGAREHASADQAAQSPESETGGVDAVVVGLDDQGLGTAEVATDEVAAGGLPGFTGGDLGELPDPLCGCGREDAQADVAHADGHAEDACECPVDASQQEQVVRIAPTLARTIYLRVLANQNAGFGLQAHAPAHRGGGYGHRPRHRW